MMSNPSESTDEAPRPPPAAVPAAEPSSAPSPVAATGAIASEDSGETAPDGVGDAAISATHAADGSDGAPPVASDPSGAEESDSGRGTAVLTDSADVDGVPAAPGTADAKADARGADESDASETDSDGKKKRRRRRRRKKKAGDGTEADGPAVEASKKPASPAPLAAFFEGGAAAKRHAFSVGEIVAGRVKTAEGGTIVVDLFGKATATIDEYEPWEVEALPEVPAASPASPGDGTAPEVVAESAETAATPSVVVSEGTDNAADETVAPADAQATGDVSNDDVSEVAASDPMAAEAANAAVNDESGATDAPAGTDTTSAGAEPAEEEGPPPEPPPIGSIFRGRVGAVSESGHIALVNRVVDRASSKERLANARDERRRVRGIVFGFNRGGFDVLVHGIRSFCPASGMSLEAIADPRIHVGKKYEFSVQPRKSSGQGFVVSRRALLEREARKARRARLRELEVGSDVAGRVTQVRDFGVFVDIGDGLEGLVHQSELSWSRSERPANVVAVGDEVQVRILSVGHDKKKDDGPKKRDRQPRVGLSLKALQPDPWDAHPEVVEEGKWLKGTVVSTTDFGAFIQLAPGIEGLVHISELGKDLKHAKQALADGQEIDVVVERVDRGQRRLSLSKLTPSEVAAIRDGTFDPASRPRSLKPGSHVKVVVDRVEHGGATVMIQGVIGKKGRGFIPNRELGSYGTGEKRRSLTAGRELEVKIAGIERDGGYKLSIKSREVDDERKAVREYRKETASQGLGTFGDLLRAKLPPSGSE